MNGHMDKVNVARREKGVSSTAFNSWNKASSEDSTGSEGKVENSTSARKEFKNPHTSGSRRYRALLKRQKGEEKYEEDDEGTGGKFEEKKSDVKVSSECLNCGRHGGKQGECGEIKDEGKIEKRDETQRVIPFRSASFSQVNLSSCNQKSETKNDNNNKLKCQCKLSLAPTAYCLNQPQLTGSLPSRGRLSRGTSLYCNSCPSTGQSYSRKTCTQNHTGSREKLKGSKTCNFCCKRCDGVVEREDLKELKDSKRESNTVDTGSMSKQGLEKSISCPTKEKLLAASGLTLHSLKECEIRVSDSENNDVPLQGLAPSGNNTKIMKAFKSFSSSEAENEDKNPMESSSSNNSGSGGIERVDGDNVAGDFLEAYSPGNTGASSVSGSGGEEEPVDDKRSDRITAVNAKTSSIPSSKDLKRLTCEQKITRQPSDQSDTSDEVVSQFKASDPIERLGGHASPNDGRKLCTMGATSGTVGGKTHTRRVGVSGSNPMTAALLPTKHHHAVDDIGYSSSRYGGKGTYPSTTSSSCPLSAALALDTTKVATGIVNPNVSGTMHRCASSSPMTSFSSTPASPNSAKLGKEITRANSVSCSGLGSSNVPGGMSGMNNGNFAASSSSLGPRQLPPPRRYYKRPLRGPYGEMLEAEMNKLIPPRRRDIGNGDDSFEFFRETKSSSPNRTVSTSTPNSSGTLPSKKPMSKVGNPLLASSMDDLNLTKTINPSTASASSLSSAKHQYTNNTRARKISTNIPVIPSTHYVSGVQETASAPLAFHQRTASSPSQLSYIANEPHRQSSSLHGFDKSRLEGSPRGHVLAEIIDTEKSYVESLRILVKKYMEPLKSSDFIDNGLVDEIFYQIPDILWHHERLLDALQKRVTNDTQSVGDVLLDTFRQNSLLECYSLFVNNWKNAKGTLKMAVASKPSLTRFLDSNARQHKGKLSLDSLLIMPIQRIPRYELLVKELVKYTEPVHEDHSRLVLVLEKIKKFAAHIDCASVDPLENREIEIDGWTSGLGHLVRQDLVTLCTTSNGRKERALFLFADCVLVASVKRKNTMRKTSSSVSHSQASALEGCKFKMLMKVALTDVHVMKDNLESGSCATCSSMDELDDLKTVHKMMELASLLKCSHLGLDDLLKEIASGLRPSCDHPPDSIQIEIKTQEGDNPETFRILFGSVEKKNVWLDTFQETLNKFIRYGFGRVPHVQFLQALPIRKTRAGLQLSCAAPVYVQNKVSKTLDMSDVWVANSDGYVGQICILTLQPEPAITSCNGVCNSRISCIVAVPPSPPASLHVPLRCTSSQPPESDPQPKGHHSRHHSNISGLDYESEDDAHLSRAATIGHKGYSNTEHWSVWLGTEDGALHIYDCSDSVRVKKNRHKIQHKAPLNSILYFDNRVFVALGNGDVAVYCRNSSGKGWSIGDPSWLSIATSISPVTKMISLDQTLWCSCGSQLKVYGENNGNLELIETIQMACDEGSQLARSISILTASTDFIWIALQGSSTLKCYGSTDYEPLFQTDVAPYVSKILEGCDDIIRQHKSACLRITALLIAPDNSLWIGTSAGVILTLSPMGPDNKISPLCQGHTGQVRFLSCCTSKDNCIVISGGDGYEEFRPATSMLSSLSIGGSSSLASTASSLLGSSSVAESSVDLSGREDSTNHLLIWKIPSPL